MEIIEEKEVRVLPLQKKSNNGHRDQKNFIQEQKKTRIHARSRRCSCCRWEILFSNQKLSWDADNKFSDSRVNDKYLMKDYHNGYKLPT